MFTKVVTLTLLVLYAISVASVVHALPKLKFPKFKKPGAPTFVDCDPSQEFFIRESIDFAIHSQAESEIYMKSLKGKCFSDPIWDRYKRVYGDQNPDSYEFARQYIKELRAAPLTAATVRCGDVKACAGGDVSVVIQGPADSRDRFAYCGPIRNRHIVVCEPFWTLAETHNVKRGARILSMEWMRHKRSANGAGRKT